jgi:hypothetical protein
MEQSTTICFVPIHAEQIYINTGGRYFCRDLLRCESIEIIALVGRSLAARVRVKFVIRHKELVSPSAFDNICPTLRYLVEQLKSDGSFIPFRNG